MRVLGRRRRASRFTALLGMVAALVVGWMLAASTASSSTPMSGMSAADAAPAAPLTGAVDVTGAPVGGALGWTAERTQPGRYQLTFDADLSVDVLSWDVPAAVTVKPVDAGTWLVDFIEEGTPVDTAFSFTATLLSE
jgi:hypothetical protein